MSGSFAIVLLSRRNSIDSERASAPHHLVLEVGDEEALLVIAAHHPDRLAAPADLGRRRDPHVIGAAGLDLVPGRIGEDDEAALLRTAEAQPEQRVVIIARAREAAAERAAEADRPAVHIPDDLIHRDRRRLCRGGGRCGRGRGRLPEQNRRDECRPAAAQRAAQSRSSNVVHSVSFRRPASRASNHFSGTRA
ncbi:hypothetical protein [Aquabacter spiritensis]|uniref:hypothetical protein n=1 Tax=Aquabacter spiritensis TaxID=933073 RepID=UPI001A9D484E|nr:hypothetical protein [Aquabacter spiritensis]